MPTNNDAPAFLWVVENGEKRLIGEVAVCTITPNESLYTVTCGEDGEECVKQVSITDSIDYTFHIKK